MVTPRVVRIPLKGYRVPGITKTLVRVVLDLWVRSQPHVFQPMQFRLDSAAGMTSMSVNRAIRLQMPVSRKAVEFSLETATGKVRQLRHPGYITVRVPGLEGRDFVWPCHFVPHAGPPPMAVLGLAGVLDDLRITLDGSYAPEAPYGWLILEELAAS